MNKKKKTSIESDKAMKKDKKIKNNSEFTEEELALIAAATGFNFDEI